MGEATIHGQFSIAILVCERVSKVINNLYMDIDGKLVGYIWQDTMSVYITDASLAISMEEFVISH